jgi:hypothetical protein
METRTNLIVSLLKYVARDLIWAIALAICLFGWNRTIRDTQRIESEMTMRLHDISILYDDLKARYDGVVSPFKPGTFPDGIPPKITPAKPASTTTDRPHA